MLTQSDVFIIENRENTGFFQDVINKVVVPLAYN